MHIISINMVLPLMRPLIMAAILIPIMCLMQLSDKKYRISKPMYCSNCKQKLDLITFGISALMRETERKQYMLHQMMVRDIPTAIGRTMSMRRVQAATYHQASAAAHSPAGNRDK